MIQDTRLRTKPAVRLVTGMVIPLWFVVGATIGYGIGAYLLTQYSLVLVIVSATRASKQINKKMWTICGAESFGNPTKDIIF